MSARIHRVFTTSLSTALLIAWGCSFESPVDPGDIQAAKGGGGPTVQSADPPQTVQDTTLNVRVVGTGFDSGSAVKFLLNGQSAPKLVTNGTTFIDKNTLIASVTVAIDAEIAAYDVEVTTRRGKKGIGTELFSVTEKSNGNPNSASGPCLASDPSCAIVVLSVGRGPMLPLVAVGEVWGEAGSEQDLDDLLGVTGLDLHFGYFVTRFPACFADDVVIGTGTYTINRDGDGEFLFAFDGKGSDGAPLDYELRLTGAPSGPWPAVRGQMSSFETAQWELTASGRRAKKVGCQGTGTFDKSTFVRIKARPAPHPFPVTPPFLSRPFAGDFPVGGFYDHEGPGGDRLTWWGESGAANSELDGYVFWTPAGTPLLAAAPGTVIHAGADGVYMCSNGVINDTQLTVAIEHTAPNGEVLITHFRMLSRIDVSVGNVVVAGQTIGLSGGYECSDTPRVFFTVRPLQAGFFDAFVNGDGGFYVRTDPYGWAGAGLEPITEDLIRTNSHYLWLPGEAPPLYREKYKTILQSDAPLTITAFRFAGVDDDANPNNESVRIEVTPSFTTSGSFDLTGYGLEDDDGNVFSFPAGFTIQTGVPVRIFSGLGTDTATELYWGRTTPVWSNITLERAHLIDAAGVEIDDFGTWDPQTDDPSRPSG